MKKKNFLSQLIKLILGVSFVLFPLKAWAGESPNEATADEDYPKSLPHNPKPVPSEIDQSADGHPEQVAEELTSPKKRKVIETVDESSPLLEGEPKRIKVREPEVNPSHLFDLDENPHQEKTYHDSRAFCEELKFGDLSFTKWHRDQITQLKDLTPKVRKTLTWPGNSTAPKNLLKHRVDLFVNNEHKKIIEDEDRIWISGWPTPRIKKKLSENHSEQQFYFLSDTILDFDARYVKGVQEQKTISKELGRDIEEGYYFEGKSYLIDTRMSYHRQNLETAIRDGLSYFNKRYLHTEQGLLRHLGSEEFLSKMDNALSEAQLKEGGTISLVINMASSHGVCLRCSDRLFRESEWGKAFLREVENKIKERQKNIAVKLHFLVSAFESYEDKFNELESFPLRKVYTDSPTNIHNLIGFSLKDSNGFCPNINFMDDLRKREKFDPNKPRIGQQKL